MLDAVTLSHIKNEAQILLNRALLNQTVNAFGIDGNGQHGTSYQAKHFKITDIELIHDITSDDLDPVFFAWINLENYLCHTDGHIATDNNLKISLNSLFAAHSIDPSCWSWSSIDKQGFITFTIDVNLSKLLEW